MINVLKEYLYLAEQNGYLSDDQILMMREDLIAVGIEPSSIETSGTTTSQVAYGQEVTVKCRCSFLNPIYSLLSKEEKGSSYYTVANVNSMLTYERTLTATAKW